MTGQRFGALLVVEYAGGQQPKWRCRCDCGAIVLCRRHNLLSGRQRSCGCQIWRPPLPEHVRAERLAASRQRSELKQAQDLSDSYVKKQLRNRGVLNPTAEQIAEKREQLRLRRFARIKKMYDL